MRIYGEDPEADKARIKELLAKWSGVKMPGDEGYVPNTTPLLPSQERWYKTKDNNK